MLRLAKPGDVARIIDMLVEQHRVSRYAHLEMDKGAARRLIASAIQRNFGQHEGGCLVVVEVVDNRIEAVMVGLLERVFFIGTDLTAKDMFLITTKRASPTAALKLIAAYRKWADDNPKVVEVELSYSDIVAGSERMGDIYERMGFVPCARGYRRDSENIREAAAA